MVYRSQIHQSLHYFARPHMRVPREPIASEAAWRGRDFEGESVWRETLGTEDLAEIDTAVARVRGRGVASLRLADFPLPRLSARVRRWRTELSTGRGFVVISGLPVDAYPAEDIERLFWALGLHLGVPGAQNPEGDLLGHVRDTGAPGDGTVRQYKTRESIDFHCDLADVVGLLCLAPAKRGGRSRLASTAWAYDELLRRRPHLADRLFEPFMLDTKGEGGAPFVPVIPCAFDGAALRTFWHLGYFRSAERWPTAPPLDARARDVLDLYDTIMNEEGTALSMALRPGDIQLVSNHSVAHARTGFEDHEDPARRRHLLRLWLSLPARVGLAERYRREKSRIAVLWRLMGARWRR